MSETPMIEPQVSGKMFLFEKPELLSREIHGKHGVNRVEKPFSFCAKVRAVPITVSEFVPAARHYPIILSDDKAMVPLAVVGLIDDVNLFVGEDGKWENSAYVPGYLRRYPFALASETGGERVAVVLDAAHESISQNAQTPFFVDGKPSEAMQSAIDFCEQYERDRLATEQTMRSLEPFKLLAGQSVQYGARRDAEQKTFAQYFGFEEKRVNELPDDKFLELRRLGVLPILHAQMMSMGNWRMLLDRRARRFNLTGDAVLEKVKLS